MKTIENRGRPIPRALVGERVAIHAGAELPRRFAPDQRWRISIGREGGTTWEQDLREAAPGAVYLDTEDNRWNAVWSRDGVPTDRVTWGRGSCRVNDCEIATRSIVAVATVRSHEPSRAEWLRARFEASRPSNPSRTDGPPLPPWADPDAAHWYALTDVVALRTPVPVPRGQLGFWTLDPETDAAVRREEDACR